jgi:hypothetical protein
MLNVGINPFMLSVIIFSVVVLNVVAPLKRYTFNLKMETFLSIFYFRILRQIDTNVTPNTFYTLSQ